MCKETVLSILRAALRCVLALSLTCLSRCRLEVDGDGGAINLLVLAANHHGAVHAHQHARAAWNEGRAQHGNHKGQQWPCAQIAVTGRLTAIAVRLAMRRCATDPASTARYRQRG